MVWAGGFIGCWRPPGSAGTLLRSPVLEPGDGGAFGVDVELHAAEGCRHQVDVHARVAQFSQVGREPVQQDRVGLQRRRVSTHQAHHGQPFAIASILRRRFLAIGGGRFMARAAGRWRTGTLRHSSRSRAPLLEHGPSDRRVVRRVLEAALVIWFEPNWPAIIASGEPTSSMQRVWLPGVQRDDQEGPACRTASKSTGRPC